VWDVLYFRVTNLNTARLRTIFGIQISAFFSQMPPQTRNEKNIKKRENNTVLKE